MVNWYFIQNDDVDNKNDPNNAKYDFHKWIDLTKLSTDI